MERVNSTHRDEYRYRITTMACAAVALIAALMTVWYWPEFGDDVNSDRIFDQRGVPIELEMIEQTQHVSKPPPPPAPLPPVVVPDDTILDFEELEVTSEIDIEGDEDGEAEAADFGPRIVAQADHGPKPIRFVEPEYTEAARKKKIKASVLVEVLIDEKGRVIDTKIIDRFIYEKKDEPPVPVHHVGYGVEEAALSAAERWRFRPARHGGRAVQTYYTLTFRFGV
jgi:protein TonB